MTKTREGENEYKKGLWTAEEDKILIDYVKVHGKGQWNRIANKTGLKRCGKRCRLRWMNYLRPNVKRGNFTEEEEDLVIRLHKLLGNRWSLIAKRVPGRTDNQVKNYWNTHLSRKLGIREQVRRGGDSSVTHSEKVDAGESAAGTSPCDNTNAPTAKNLLDQATQNAVSSSAAQESMIDEGFMNSLCNVYDDLGLGIFTMMGFMDGYSLI